MLFGSLFCQIDSILTTFFLHSIYPSITPNKRNKINSGFIPLL